MNVKNIKTITTVLIYLAGVRFTTEDLIAIVGDPDKNIPPDPRYGLTGIPPQTVFSTISKLRIPPDGSTPIINTVSKGSRSPSNKHQRDILTVNSNESYYIHTGKTIEHRETNNNKKSVYEIMYSFMTSHSKPILKTGILNIVDYAYQAVNSRQPSPDTLIKQFNILKKQEIIKEIEQSDPILADNIKESNKLPVQLQLFPDEPSIKEVEEKLMMNLLKKFCNLRKIGTFSPEESKLFYGMLERLDGLEIQNVDLQEDILSLTEMKHQLEETVQALTEAIPSFELIKKGNIRVPVHV